MPARKIQTVQEEEKRLVRNGEEGNRGGKTQRGAGCTVIEILITSTLQRFIQR